jgi:hypothetical protein
MGAGSNNVAIGQKLLGGVIVKLSRYLFPQKPATMQDLKKSRGLPVVGGSRCPRKMGEFHPDALERIANNRMVPVHQIPGVHPFFAGLQCDGNPVFIRPAD